MNEHPIERCGINYDESDTKDKPWCFYDRKLFEKYTSKDNCYERIEKARWDFDKKHNGKKPKLTDYLRYYNRFKPTENK